MTDKLASFYTKPIQRPEEQEEVKQAVQEVESRSNGRRRASYISILIGQRDEEDGEEGGKARDGEKMSEPVASSNNRSSGCNNSKEDDNDDDDNDDDDDDDSDENDEKKRSGATAAFVKMFQPFTLSALRSIPVGLWFLFSLYALYGRSSL